MHAALRGTRFESYFAISTSAMADPTRGRGRRMALKPSTPGKMGNHMFKIRIFLRVIFGKWQIE
ncbi:hypothetical protein DCC61_03840 [Candidatus Microgenomates bacterium]|nr:MAG: hypothetical protein DCC61_03840 [Candidatus Microgenomates bacterium]